MSSLTTHVRAPLAAAAASLLLLAACGGDDVATVDPTTTTASTTTTVAPADPPDAGIPVADTPDGTPDPVAPVGSPATADRSSPGFPAAGEPALLESVDVDQYDDVDRITFSFVDGAPEDLSWRIEAVEAPVREQPSGQEVTVLGETFQVLTIAPASGVDLSGDEAVQTFAGPDRIRAPEDGGLSELVEVSDFEGSMQFALGLPSVVPIGIAVLSGDGEGTRLVVDVLRTTAAEGEVTLGSVDEGIRDFTVVTYPSEQGRCFELRLPTDAEPDRSAVECDPAAEPLAVRVLRQDDTQALVGLIPTGSTVVDVDLVANDGSIIAPEFEDVEIVDLGAGTSAFLAPQDPAFVSAIIGYDANGDEVARVDL